MKLLLSESEHQLKCRKITLQASAIKPAVEADLPSSHVTITKISRTTNINELVRQRRHPPRLINQKNKWGP